MHKFKTQWAYQFLKTIFAGKLWSYLILH